MFSCICLWSEIEIFIGIARTKNHRWSSKIGWGKATNLDNSGDMITDPQTANTGDIHMSYCDKQIGIEK